MWGEKLETIEFDSEKITDIGENIISLSNEFKEQVEYLFNYLTQVDSYGAWIGASASTFMNRACNDKVQYLAFQKAISQEGTFLVQVGHELESVTSSLKR